MIKEIFLPERIGSKRLLSQHIAGIALQEDSVQLAIVYSKRSGSVVENLVLQNIEQGPEDTYPVRAAQALKHFLPQIKHVDQIRASIPASIVTFKELQMPFTDSEKIRMVIDYEIESMLPFSPSEAVIDFITTKKIPDQGASQVFVAAVRNQDLESFLDIYKQAGIEPSHITIDLFAAYGLYQQIQDYSSITQGSTLINIDETSTQIAFLQNSELRLTRSIPRGFTSLVKNISEETKIPEEEVIQKFISQGIKIGNDDPFNKAVSKHLINFLNDIQFTLNSFSLKLNFYEGVNRLLFSGKFINIKNFIEFCTNTLQIPCEIFDCKKLFVKSRIKTKIKDIRVVWSNFIIALGTALPPEQQSDFDLRRKNFVLPNITLITKQLVTAVIVILFMLITIGINGYVQIAKLKSNFNAAQRHGIERIKSIFPKEKLVKSQSLSAVVQSAEQILKDNQKLYAPFLKEKMNALDIIFELTDILDKSIYNVSLLDATLEDKEAEEIRITVEGNFKAKGDAQYNEWTPLEQKIKESQFFQCVEEPYASSIEGKGLKFSLKLKLKKSK
jgi:type IV pilus assembly protein PilM